MKIYLYFLKIFLFIAIFNSREVFLNFCFCSFCSFSLLFFLLCFVEMLFGVFVILFVYWVALGFQKNVLFRCFFSLFFLNKYFLKIFYLKKHSLELWKVSLISSSLFINFFFHCLLLLWFIAFFPNFFKEIFVGVVEFFFDFLFSLYYLLFLMFASFAIFRFLL